MLLPGCVDNKPCWWAINVQWSFKAISLKYSLYVFRDKICRHTVDISPKLCQAIDLSLGGWAGRSRLTWCKKSIPPSSVLTAKILKNKTIYRSYKCISLLTLTSLKSANKNSKNGTMIQRLASTSVLSMLSHLGSVKFTWAVATGVLCYVRR